MLFFPYMQSLIFLQDMFQFLYYNSYKSNFHKISDKFWLVPSLSLHLPICLWKIGPTVLCVHTDNQFEGKL